MADHDDTDDIDIRIVETPVDLRRLVVLLNQVWGTMTPLVGVELLRALGHTGAYVAGAFSDNRMVGGSLGFLGRHNGELVLHSHVTGILPGVRKTGLGRQMKLHQRQWAAEQGLETIVWTFDPLVRRNAWFNVGVLGARVDAYLVDFYGPMSDSVNGRDPSDRLLVAWPTSGPLPPPTALPSCPPGRSPCRPRTTSSCCAGPTPPVPRHGAYGCARNSGARSPTGLRSSGSPATANTSCCRRPES